MALSGALHAGLILGFGSHRKPAPKHVFEDNLIAVSIIPPQIKELEEPDKAPSDDVNEKPDMGTPVPMQADMPQLPSPNDFIQQLDFASLVPPPDFKDSNMFTIPEHIRRGGKITEGLGNIFNLADLDRHPEPLSQPSPIFPIAMKREAETGSVTVQFVVDAEGHVLNIFVVESTHRGFDEAAIAGVAKWRFRAGIKNGRKVNTRMQVPILFRLMSASES